MKQMRRMPEYTDGVLTVYKITEQRIGDFPQKVLVKTDLDIWYREISVFDRTKYDFEQGGKEVTMKLRIPRYKGICSNHACMIEGMIHQIYNAAHVDDKNGFPETELTLIRPDKELIIS